MQGESSKVEDKSFNNQDLNESGFWQKQQEKKHRNTGDGSTDYFGY